MKTDRKITAKRVGTALAVLFIVGLSIATVYSRSYAERRKPLVQVAFSDTFSVSWSWDTVGTLNSATDEEVLERGHEWISEFVIPYEAYRDYLSEIIGATASIRRGHSPAFTRTTLVRWTVMGNGDVHMTLSYTPVAPAIPVEGERIAIRVEHRGTVGEPGQGMDNLIPLHAVHTDTLTGVSYIFLLNRRDGAWGREYFVERVDVLPGMPRQVGNYAVVLNNLRDRSVVVMSDVALYHGASVRIFD